MPSGPRSELGVPTVFNFLGPVANPARPQAHAVGVADARMGEVLAGVLAARGSSALVFHGDDGLDELTTTTTSAVWLAHGSAVTATEFDPAELGIARAQPDQLRGGDATHNAAVMRAVLAGETGPVRDIVLLNAAAALAADAGVGGQKISTRCWRRAWPGRPRRWTRGPRTGCSTAGSRPASACLASAVWLALSG